MPCKKEKMFKLNILQLGAKPKAEIVVELKCGRYISWEKTKMKINVFTIVS